MPASIEKSLKLIVCLYEMVYVCVCVCMCVCVCVCILHDCVVHPDRVDSNRAMRGHVPCEPVPCARGQCAPRARHGARPLPVGGRVHWVLFVMSE